MAARCSRSCCLRSSARRLRLRRSPQTVVVQFIRFADFFGGRLVAAFDSIPVNRYAFRPTPAQQTVGYIAQHLEAANYGLCERLGAAKHHRTSKDSLADTIKATWPTCHFGSRRSSDRRVRIRTSGRAAPARHARAQCAASFQISRFICFSRLYLGVHYPSDVLAGVVIGLAWAAFCMAILEAAQLYAKYNAPQMLQDERPAPPGASPSS